MKAFIPPSNSVSDHRLSSTQFLMGLLALGVVLLTSCTTARRDLVVVPKWDQFETRFKSTQSYQNPLQEVDFRVVFESPSGVRKPVYGFWDGRDVWRVRFSPNEVGTWKYTTICSDPANQGLDNQSGSFLCTASLRGNRLSEHGPVRLSYNQRYLMHDDGTPFFFLADTAWNGALKSTPKEWNYYLRTRHDQNFTAVQWVTTQWRAAPDGDLTGTRAYSGTEQIQIHPEFFQRLDQHAAMVHRAGLLNVPVLLWAISGGSNPEVNPGHSLPEDQAILLARYMVARWQGLDVVWLLGGDGDYRGEKADRWKRIGRAVFGEIDHAPVAMHPGGMHWIHDEFASEEWVDIHGYQSGHSTDANRAQWIHSGPPAQDWKKNPPLPFINLEPPYENHIGYQSKQPISAAAVRRATYWSLLNAPTAGVSYGGHGVWGWDSGEQPPVDHPNSGVPLPWQKALHMPAAEQMRYLYNFFASIDFYRLRPAPGLVADQPGEEDPLQHIAAAQTAARDLAVLYVPSADKLSLNLSELPHRFSASWFNPRNGNRPPVEASINEGTIHFPLPAPEDWLLLIRASE